MKVTLVNPPQTASKYKFMGVIAPPLGIGYIAAVLRDNGIDVNILDASAEDMDFKEFSEEIKNRSPDIISISALTPTINKALETAKTAKEVLPNSIIVMGGYHPTFDFEETLKNDFVDIVIRGEGEYVLRDLVETIENNGDLREVRGIVFKEDDNIVLNPNADLIYDLDALPFPAFDLMPMDKYKLLDMDTHMATMITTRGCPMKCSFCSSAAMHGRKMRQRSVDNILAEIDFLREKYDINTIAFMDDTFTLKKSRLMEFCDKLKQKD